MYGLTGAQVLTFTGADASDPDNVQWADLVAAALVAGVTTRLNGATIADGSAGEKELNVALLIGGAEAYKRREATFGLTGYADLEGNAIRIAKDYLDGIKPLINRYNAGPGIG